MGFIDGQGGGRFGGRVETTSWVGRRVVGWVGVRSVVGGRAAARGSASAERVVGGTRLAARWTG